MGRHRRHAASVRGRRVALDGQRRSELAWLDWHRPRSRSASWRRCGVCRRKRAATASRTRCCSAWAAPACARKCGEKTFGRDSPARRSCSCSTRPTRRRFARSRQRSTSRARCSSSRASRARRSSRTSSRRTSSTREADSRRRQGGAAGSSPMTDPGSNLEKEAKADGFRHIFPGVKSIGGRYSALSNFGMVPAAVDGPRRRAAARPSAERMLHACAPGVGRRGQSRARARHDPRRGGQSKGIDKLTIVASPGIHDLGAWLEQLIAESTGKDGKGIIPVDRETRRGARRRTGTIGCSLTCGSRTRRTRRRTPPSRRSRRRASPSSRFASRRRYDLAAEFFRWEIATAIAGAVIGINPFNQPDVEASKIATRALTERVREDRHAAGRSAVLRGRRHQAVRRRRQCRRARRRAAATLVADRISQGASRSPRHGRLLRAARVHRR